jgi:hypothetical protein
MSKYHCPRCEFDRSSLGAPLGKIVRRVAWTEEDGTSIESKQYEDCKACNGTGFIPDAVIAGIQKTFPNVTEMALSTLKWDMDHYYFIRFDCYIGVELDGHCHS